MSEFEMVAAASLDAYPVAVETMTEVGQGWFGTVMAGEAARLAVAARAAAVNGDDAGRPSGRRPSGFSARASGGRRLARCA
jgi:hypothetical protein